MCAERTEKYKYPAGGWYTWEQLRLSRFCPGHKTMRSSTRIVASVHIVGLCYFYLNGIGGDNINSGIEVNFLSAVFITIEEGEVLSE